KPVGCSIKYGTQASRYWAWGHPTANNCTWAQGRAAVLTAANAAPFVAHNGGFEAAILRDYFDWTPPNSEWIHDTVFLLFLTNPYEQQMSLKLSAARLLNWPPEEQDDLRTWILQNVPEARVTPSEWGAYICRAPGDLVGRYACGDTDRTSALFDLLYPLVVEHGMEPAYRREQKLAPILWESTRQGLRLDVEALERDYLYFRQLQRASQDFIFGELGEFEISKKDQLADALERAGQVTHWERTPTGRRSTKRVNLMKNVKDPELMAHLAYYTMLETCLGTFGEPWLALAESDGRLHASWNQVRGARNGENSDGARTGRMSCSAPNLTNVPNDFEDFVFPQDVGPILLRRYLLPEDGHIWFKRDFDAQEMRWLANYSEGKLSDAFHADPKADPHATVGRLILDATGIELPRKHVKTTGFGIMYGRGIASTAAALGIPLEQGEQVRNAYFAALPEVRALSSGVRKRLQGGGFIRTWGGRIYYVEPNPDRDLAYKGLNYLIQGSAADQTKESIIAWHATRGHGAQLLAAVHDEINISAPEGCGQMRLLREAMDADRADVPFRSQGYKGPNWATLEKCA
ncbi:MAG: DNA polymerase, partial [Vicinamibacterales bacterium]